MRDEETDTNTSTPLLSTPAITIVDCNTFVNFQGDHFDRPKRRLTTLISTVFRLNPSYHFTVAFFR
jgi:hypothetical protein